MFIAKEPYLFFVDHKRKHRFLYQECLEIYEYLIQNSEEKLPIIGYERLNDIQTFFDIRNTLFPNSSDIFANKKNIPEEEVDPEEFIQWFNLERRDLMEELVEDLVDSFRYHQLFFVKEYECVSVMNTQTLDSEMCNRPVRKVW